MHDCEAARVSGSNLKELRLQRALIDDQEATNRFFMAYEEMIPPESFFNPKNLRTIMERCDKGQLGALDSMERCWVSQVAFCCDAVRRRE